MIVSRFFVGDLWLVLFRPKSCWPEDLAAEKRNVFYVERILNPAYTFSKIANAFVLWLLEAAEAANLTIVPPQA